MNSHKTEYRRSIGNYVFGIIVCVFFAAMALAALAAALFAVFGLDTPVILLIVISIIVALVLAITASVAVWNLTCLADREIKLTVDSSGVTDHRHYGGPLFLPWEEIDNMDFEVETIDSTVRKAHITVYVVSDRHGVEDFTINIAGLNAKPREVYSDIRKKMLEWERDTGRQDPLDED